MTPLHIAVLSMSVLGALAFAGSVPSAPASTVSSTPSAGFCALNATLYVYPAVIDAGSTAVVRPFVHGPANNFACAELAPLHYAYAGLPAGCPSATGGIVFCTPAIGGTYPITVTISTPGSTVEASATLTVIGPVPA